MNRMQLKLLGIACFLCFFMGHSVVLVAQPIAPKQVHITGTSANTIVEWIDGGNNNSAFVRYEIGRSNTRGAGYAVIGNTTTFTFTDPAPLSTQAYYVVRDVYATGTTAWSEEIIRFWPKDGAVADVATTAHRDTVWANWPIYENEIVKTYVGLSTTPGTDNVVSFKDVGHATEYTFTGLNLASGTTYYVTVKVLNTTGYLNDYGTSICSSNGFLVSHNQFFSDLNSTGYFNEAQTLVRTVINPNDLTSLGFSGNGGGEWRYRIPVTVTERGIESRLNAPCEFSITRPLAEVAANRWDEELRVADEFGNEVPVIIMSQTSGGGNNTATATMIVNVPLGQSVTYWVFWGNPSATVPAYGFITNTNDTSQRAFSKYYSRKLLPPGAETVNLSGATRYLPGGVRDDQNTSVNLPWTGWRFFDTTFNAWRFSTNSWLTGGNFNTWTNVMTTFTNNSNPPGGSIAPMWCDTMINDTAPQNSGFYTIQKDSGQPTDRFIYYWRANRYNYTDDIYIHQAVLYRYGDIALRYEYLSPGALWEDGQPTDNGINDLQNTAGISRNNNTDWFTVTPLMVGIGLSPTCFFQYKSAMTYALGTVEDAGAGWGFAGHMDSRIIDSLAANPDWTTLTYTIAAGGGRFTILTRTGQTPLPDGSWSAWSAIATNVNVSGSGAVTSPDQRYLQYRAVFQHAAPANTPLLDDITVACQGISVETVVATTTNGISQGQNGIPVQVTVKNFHVAAVQISSLTLLPSLGSYTITLVSPLPLPTALNSGATLIATFLVDVWDDSPVGTATIHAAASTSAPIVFQDNDANSPHQWWIRKKANLVITAIDTVPTTVNKGQNGIPVQLELENTGETPYTIDGATLTFTLGSYSYSLISPPLGTVVSGPGSVTLNFSLNVLPTSPSGVAILNGTASGTNTFSGKITHASSTAMPDSWTVQNPASLILDQVVASSVVYRGQTQVPVFLTVTNYGEAKGNWESSDILSHFTLGTYDAVSPAVPFPITIFGGLASTAKYSVDISPLTATGTSVVDADISGTDGNTVFPISCSGALLPTSWNILAEKVVTYKDATLLYPSASYNRPSVGTTTVYAEGTNLAPFKEFAVRWYDPSGNQIASTNPPLTANGSGTLFHQYGLNPTSAYGVWTVRITDPLNTYTACQTNFSVVSGASLSVTLSLPNSVSIGQTFIGSMTFINSGGAQIKSAYPGRLATSAGGLALLTAGPTPNVQDVPGDGQATFTFSWTANAAGTFLATGSGNGFDANSDAFLTSASGTSNPCLVQTAPVLSITGLTAVPTTVYRNQYGIEVTLAIRNTGQATAHIDAASLSFSLGSHSQSIASPAFMPYQLLGNSVSNLVFNVNIASASPTGLANISGSFAAHDANNPLSTFGITGGADSWTIAAVSGICAANTDFNPEQYAFNINQTVYARFEGLALNTIYRIRFYNLAPTGGTLVKTSPKLNSGAFGRADDTWWLSPADVNSIPRKWRITIEDDLDLNAGTNGTIFGTQFFDVQNAGNLVGSLTLSPSTVFIGETVTATMVASNTISTASTIFPATPAALLTTPLSTGALVPIDGPNPASATIGNKGSATFTWTFTASVDTGLVGSYSLTSLPASGVSGLDINTGVGTESKYVISNSIKVYRRGMTFGSATIDFGTMECGTNKTIGNTSVTNSGNYNLSSVQWNKADLNGSGTLRISNSYLDFTPDPVGAIAPNGVTYASSSLSIPFNLASGPYIATMSIFEDINGNSAQDASEPYSLFNVRVIVPNTKRLLINESLIDLGDYTVGQLTASKTVSALNIGNMTLTNLKFKQTAATSTFPLTITPSTYGSLSTTTVLIATVSANITVGPSGIFIATWTLWNDEDGDSVIDATEASDTVQVRVGVGAKSFTLAPATVNAGIGTPTYVVANLPFILTNTGSLPLSNLKGMYLPLSTDTYTIASDNITIEPIAVVPQASAPTCYFSIYVPAGQEIGTYTGTQWIFEDNNGNNICDAGEASMSIQLQIQVPPYRAVQVLMGTVDLGGIAPGNSRTVSFPCRNIGNITLSLLRWSQTNLYTGPTSLSSANVTFPPTLPFTALAGKLFNHDITIAVPGGQAFGNYLSTAPHYFLYEDFSPTNLARDAAEPQDDFMVACQVGNQALDIIEPSLAVSAAPSLTAGPAAFTISNTGTLTISNPKATGTPLIPLIVGPSTIAASNHVFSPNPIGYILPAQNRPETWSVTVPANSSAAVYIATMTVWEDSDNDGIIDPTEASTTCPLQLTVPSAKVIQVLQNPFDVGWTTEGTTIQGVFQVDNVGNLPLSQVRPIASSIRDVSSNQIPAASMSFTPAIIGPMAVGTSVLATLSINVGIPQADGTYRAWTSGGWLTVYDDYSPANGAKDAGEESTRFELIAHIGKKGLSVSTPVDFGAQNPDGTYSTALTVTNTQPVPLSRVRWLKGNLLKGVDQIASSNLSFTPAGPFGIGGNLVQNCTANVTIGTYTPAGIYTGSTTAWEDGNNNGSIDAGEASSTFTVNVTVNSFRRLNILPTKINVGKIPRGANSAPFDIGYQNTGNVTLNFTPTPWILQALATPSTGSPIASYIPAASLTFTPIPPLPLAPGAFATQTLTIGIVSATQVMASYSENQTFQDSGLPAATDFLTVACEVIAGGPQISGSIRQSIATSSFAAAAPNNRFIISAWVCPATGSAGIGLFSFKNSDQIQVLPFSFGAIIDSAGNLTATGSPVEIGIIESSPGKHPSYPTQSFMWYRIYAAFDYTFDSLQVETMWLLLMNTSVPGGAVWFDGVQLEKAVFPNQTRPTAFDTRKKIISPNISPDLSGGKRYFEW